MLKRKRAYSALALVISYFIIYGVFHGFSIDLSKDFNENAIRTSIQTSKLPTIILDAGHGGMDGGCVAYNGKLEKDVNLSVTLILKDYFESFGYSVELTRDSDKAIYDDGVEGLSNKKKSDMKNRLAIFNKYQDAVAISIHQNQFTDEKYSGAQMFYCDSNDKNNVLANILQNTIKDNLQKENNREIKNSKDDLYLLKNCVCPSVMVECGFLSNKQEADKLFTKSYQKQLAFCIFLGANTFINQNINSV